jgi:putative redox protein
VRLAGSRAGLSAYRYGPRAPRAALLICQALAEERKGGVRVLHQLACALGASGWRVLLFDYAGTGESPGEFREVRWEGLLADVRGAAAMLRGEASAPAPLRLLGVRLGARVGLAALPEVPACLWAPTLAAPAWLREVQRRSRFRRTGEAACGPPEAGGADLDGYHLSAALAEDLTALPPPASRSAPVAVVQVGPGAEPTAATQRLTASLGDRTAVRCVPLAPFWLETAEVDAGPLVRVTQEWLDDSL